MTSRSAFAAARWPPPASKKMKSSFFTSPIVARCPTAGRKNTLINRCFWGISPVCNPRTVINRYAGCTPRRRFQAGYASVHYAPGPRSHASRPTLARAALDSRVDAVRHAGRRWMAVVRHGDDRSVVRRSRPGKGRGRRGAGGGNRHRAISAIEESRRPPAAVRVRVALLVHAVAAGPVLVSLGSHHHRVRGRSFAEPRLPGDGGGPAVLRRKRSHLPHSTRHALPQRRARWGNHRSRPGLRFRLGVWDRLIFLPPPIGIRCAGDLKHRQFLRVHRQSGLVPGVKWILEEVVGLASLQFHPHLRSPRACGDAVPSV